MTCCRVELWIDTGDQHPGEVNRLLTVPPTRTTVRGQHIPGRHLEAVYKGNHWFLSSGLDASKEFSDHCAAIMRLLRGHESELRMVSDRFHVLLDVLVETYSTYLAFGFPARQLGALGSLGIELQWCTTLLDDEDY
jgi:hypothetical protein